MRSAIWFIILCFHLIEASPLLAQHAPSPSACPGATLVRLAHGLPGSGPPPVWMGALAPRARLTAGDLTLAGQVTDEAGQPVAGWRC